MEVLEKRKVFAELLSLIRENSVYLSYHFKVKLKVYKNYQLLCYFVIFLTYILRQILHPTSTNNKIFLPESLSVP